MVNLIDFKIKVKLRLHIKQIQQKINFIKKQQTINKQNKIKQREQTSFRKIFQTIDIKSIQSHLVQSYLPIKQIRMGSSQSTSPQTYINIDPTQNARLVFEDQLLKIYRNSRGQQYQRYQIDKQVQQQKRSNQVIRNGLTFDQSYEYRLTNRSRDFVELLYFAPKQSGSNCTLQQRSESGVVTVITERIKYRLSQLYNLSFTNALTILKVALKGFKNLYTYNGLLWIKDTMIGINFYDQVKVWLNSNFALNFIEPLPLSLVNLPYQYQQDVFVSNLIDLISSKTFPSNRWKELMKVRVQLLTNTQVSQSPRGNDQQYQPSQQNHQNQHNISKNNNKMTFDLGLQMIQIMADKYNIEKTKQNSNRLQDIFNQNKFYKITQQDNQTQNQEILQRHLPQTKPHPNKQIIEQQNSKYKRSLLQQMIMMNQRNKDHKFFSSGRKDHSNRLSRQCISQNQVYQVGNERDTRDSKQFGGPFGSYNQHKGKSDQKTNQNGYSHQNSQIVQRNQHSTFNNYNDESKFNPNNHQTINQHITKLNNLSANSFSKPKFPSPYDSIQPHQTVSPHQLSVIHNNNASLPTMLATVSMSNQFRGKNEQQRRNNNLRIDKSTNNVNDIRGVKFNNLQRRGSVNNQIRYGITNASNSISKSSRSSSNTKITFNIGNTSIIPQSEQQKTQINHSLNHSQQFIINKSIYNNNPKDYQKHIQLQSNQPFNSKQSNLHQYHVNTQGVRQNNHLPFGLKTQKNHFKQIRNFIQNKSHVIDEQGNGSLRIVGNQQPSTRTAFIHWNDSNSMNGTTRPNKIQQMQRSTNIVREYHVGSLNQPHTYSKANQNKTTRQQHQQLNNAFTSPHYINFGVQDKQLQNNIISNKTSHYSNKSKQTQMQSTSPFKQLTQQSTRKSFQQQQATYTTQNMLCQQPVKRQQLMIQNNQQIIDKEVTQEQLQLQLQLQPKQQLQQQEQAQDQDHKNNQPTAQINTYNESQLNGQSMQIVVNGCPTPESSSIQQQQQSHQYQSHVDLDDKDQLRSNLLLELNTQTNKCFARQQQEVSQIKINLNSQQHINSQGIRCTNEQYRQSCQGSCNQQKLTIINDDKSQAQGSEQFLYEQLIDTYNYKIKQSQMFNNRQSSYLMSKSDNPKHTSKHVFSIKQNKKSSSPLCKFVDRRVKRQFSQNQSLNSESSRSESQTIINKLNKWQDNKKINQQQNDSENPNQKPFQVNASQPKQLNQNNLYKLQQIMLLTCPILIKGSPSNQQNMALSSKYKVNPQQFFQKMNANDTQLCDLEPLKIINGITYKQLRNLLKSSTTNQESKSEKKDNVFH